MKKSCFISKTFEKSKLYSTAVQAGDLVFISGMGPVDPVSKKTEMGDFEVQTERVLKNLGIILKEMGKDYIDVVKTNIYLSDIKNFEKANEIYCKFFTDELPARTTIQAGALPGGIDVEIEMVVNAG